MQQAFILDVLAPYGGVIASGFPHVLLRFRLRETLGNGSVVVLVVERLLRDASVFAFVPAGIERPPGEWRATSLTMSVCGTLKNVVVPIQLCK